MKNVSICKYKTHFSYYEWAEHQCQSHLYLLSMNLLLLIFVLGWWFNLLICRQCLFSREISPLLHVLSFCCLLTCGIYLACRDFHIYIQIYQSCLISFDIGSKFKKSSLPPNYKELYPCFLLALLWFIFTLISGFGLYSEAQYEVCIQLYFPNGKQNVPIPPTW